ncbi:monocarboxylate transporter 2-like [Patiria miniata]|uniref:Major facilitator superfamily (MFS) profile domain-containing protein n=1 Tax=Patiria miniata TaxID=46514 RepID=A0A914B623_PATMI|nr:monocarboxylate transporter 2-like [Patiria miniata]XP_038071563.1 monocarboxylate transporter 2-like [Patiria miniata]
MADTPPTMSTARRRENVDGGWAYLILLAAYGYFFVFAGIGKSLGVLLPTLTEQFDTQTWLLGAIISIIMLIKDISAVPSALLSTKLPVRWILIASSIVACCGIIGASLAQTITQFAVCMSVLSGLGFGFCSPLMQTLVGHYFHKKYACANGFATAGMPLGVMAMAPLTQLLLDVYGWRGALLILGGISLNLVALTLLTRPLVSHKASTDVESASSDLRRMSTEGQQRSARLLEQGNTGEQQRRRSSIRSLVVRPAAIISSGGKQFAKASDLSLFKEFSFVVVVIVCCIVRFTKTAWIIYFVPHAIDMGFGKYEASLFVTVNSVGNLLGKIVHGPLIDRKVVTRKVLLIISTTASAAALFLDRFMVTVPSMIVGQLVLGMGVGIAASLFVIVIRKVAGIKRLANSLAWASVASGLMRLLAGFVPGWIYDQTNSYNDVFLVVACVTIVCPVVVIAEAAVYKFCRKKAPLDARWEGVISDDDN